MTVSRPDPRQRGIILIAVLLAVAIMAVMVVAAAALTRAGIGNEELEQRRLASHLALRSGVEAAKALILATPEDQRVLLGGDDVSVDLGGGISASVSLRDAAGFVDLNRSDPTLIEAVARFSGLGKAANGLADRIEKLRKEAAPAQTAAQQQAAQAGQAQPGQGGNVAGSNAAADPAKAPPPPIVFLSVDQLPALLGLPEEDSTALGAGLTVYNPTGAINPLAAPDQVLQAIPGMSEADIANIALARKTGTGMADGRLQQMVQRQKGLLTDKEPRVFMVEVKLEGGPGILPGSAARAVLRVMPDGLVPFGTLALEEE